MTSSDVPSTCARASFVAARHRKSKRARVLGEREGELTETATASGPLQASNLIFESSGTVAFRSSRYRVSRTSQRKCDAQTSHNVQTARISVDRTESSELTLLKAKVKTLAKKYNHVVLRPVRRRLRAITRANDV